MRRISSEEQIRILPKVHMKKEDSFRSAWLMTAISEIKAK